MGAPDPPRHRKRRFVARAAGVVALLLAFGLFPQEPLRRWAEARLRASLGPRVHIGRLHAVPILLRLEAWDVRLGAAAFEAELPQARLGLGWRTLSGDGLHLRSVELEAPRIVLRAAPEAAPDAAPWRGPLSIGSVRVSGGRFAYAAADGTPRVELHGLSLDGTLGSGALTARATGARLDLPGMARPLDLAGAEARARVGADLHVELDDLRLTTPRSRLSARGALGGPGAWDCGLRLEGSLEAAEIGPSLGQSDIAGRVAVAGHVVEETAGLAAELAFDAPRVQAAAVSFDSVSVKLSRPPGGVTRFEAGARAWGGSLAGHATLDGGALAGALHATELDARQVAPGVAGLRGRIDGDVSARGRSGEPLDVDARAQWSGAHEGRPGRVEAQARGRADVAARQVALAWKATADLTGAGDEALRALALRASGRAEGPLPPPVMGRVEGSARVRGRDGAAPLEASFAGDVRVEGERTTARLDGRALDGTVTLEARARGARFDVLRVQGESLDLAALHPNLSGRTRLEVDARGAAARLDGTGRVDAAEIGWEQAALGPLDARLRLEGGRLRFEAEAPRLALSAAGTLADGTLRAALELRETPLAPLGRVLARELEGAASGRAQVELPFDAPLDARVEAQFTGLSLTRPLDARATEPFELRHAERRTQVRGLAAEGAGARLRAEGSFGGEPAALELRATLALALERAPLPEGASATGQVDAEVDLAGPLGALRSSGFIETRGVAGTAPGGPELRLDDSRQALDGDALALRGLTLRAAGGTLTLDGRLPWAALHARARRDPRRLDDHESLQLTLDWRDLDAAALLRPRAAQVADALDARLAGRAELTGGLARPSELLGRILLPETALVASDVPLTLAPATLLLADGRLSSEGLRFSGRDFALDLSGALDYPARTLTAQAEGALDLRLLSPFLGEASLTGRGELAALISGALDAPRVHGTLLAKQAGLRLRALRQPLTEIEAWLTFDDRELALREFTARLGGGALTGTGQARLDGRRLADVDLRLEGRGVGLHYPAGLRSRLDVDLRLTGATGAFRLAGDVRAERGLFDLDAVAEASLFGPAAKSEPSPLLRSFALDLDIATTQPLRVRRTTESLADVLATARLTLRGDLETPRPFGRVDLVPGGVALLVGRRLVVSSGRLDYRGTWNPELDLRAALPDPIQARGATSAPVTYDRLDVRGTLEAPRLVLRGQADGSELDPSRSLTVLATGRDDDALARSGGWVAAEQAAALLAGRLTRTLTRGLGVFGLDEIAIEPQLVARDTDPGARFTFAKRLTPRARAIYSHSLRDPEDRFVKLEAGPLLRLRGSVERREGGEFAYTAGQTLEFGGARDLDPARPDARAVDERVRLEEIVFEGDRPLPEPELRAALELEAGRRAGPWDVLDASEALRARLVGAGYLEAEVGAWLDGPRARVRVAAGPRYDWRVEGSAAPPAFERRLRTALFEDEALERGADELRRALVRAGHLRARVTTSVEPRPDARTLVFSVEPGPRLRLERARFRGARALSEGELLRLAGGVAGLLRDPQAAQAAWLAAYHERHYPQARVDAPRVDEAGGRVSIEARIDEGPRARLASVTLQAAGPDAAAELPPGAHLTPEELRQATGLMPGEPYSEAAAVAAAQRLRERIVGLGYPEARVTAERQPQGGDYELLLCLDAGPRVTLDALEVTGAERTRPALLRARAGLRPGETLDVRDLALAEARLLALGTLASARLSSEAASPGRLRLDVRERAPLALDYRLRYDDEDGASLETDGEWRHLFGRALVLGGRYRLGRDQRDARAFLNVPLRPGALTVSASRLSEDLPRRAFEGDTFENLRVQRELRVQQALEAFRPWVFLGGYRFKRVTLLPIQPDPFDLAALSLSVVRETRDNPFDPRHGRFYGLDVELAPEWLASDFTFLKGSAQAFFARSRGALTWAQGYRLALARGLGGQRLTSTERYRAGGAYTVRGFASDALGPQFLGQPAGGEALLVLNQELRVHHASGLGAALFYDAGNVYARASELRDLRLRHSLGAGLRYTSPFGLLRVDFGFPLGRRPGEKSWRWFFAFGQAF